MNHEPELERLRRRERELEAELSHLRARTLGATANGGQISLRGMRTTPIGPAELFAAVEKTWMPMILTDPNQPDHPIVFANRAFQELSGYGPDELIGHNCRFLQGADTDPAQVQKIREALAAQRDVAIEILNYRRDGTPFFNELYISPIFDHDGRLLYFFGSQFDITGFRQDRRLMEEGLRRQKAIFDSAADLAIFATDRAGLITEWNSGAERIFGWSAAAMRGASAALVFTPEDQDAGRLPREMSKALAENRAISERWHVRQDGSRFWGSGDMTPLLDENGSPTGFLNILRDRTEQHLAGERLAESERRYRTLFEALDAGFCVIEVELNAAGRPKDYRFIEVNPAFEAQTGIKDAGGRRVSELVPAHEPFWYELYGEVARTGQPARFEHAAEALGRWYDVHAFRVGEAGENRVAALFRDISKRRQVERDLQALTASLESEVQTRTGELMAAEEALRQSQKMEAVGQLTGGLAHDFNNLLTSITGSLDLINIRVTQGRTNDLDRYITAAQGAASRAAALTHRLLAFSRRQTLAPRPTDVNRLAADMDELIRRTVGPSITLQMHLDPELWTTLVDPNQLENALLNLCINARDAMPEGGRLTVETSNTVLDARAARERDFAPGQYISLFVTDTGTGMDPEVIARAFDPFFTTKPLGMGTGLGLSMIYGFAKQSGGQVRIHSELGHGSTVRLYLPRHQGDAAAPEPTPDLVNAPRANTDETVLVVDDEPTVRMLVTEVLEDLGYTAIEAADGAAGLKVLQSNARIDLLVTDVGLPGGMNGRQMADAARGARPALKVLFITGYAENAVLSHGHLDPGMHVLTKPFTMDTLAKRIKDLIGGEVG